MKTILISAIVFSFVMIGSGYYLGSFVTDIEHLSPSDWRFTKAELHETLEYFMYEKFEGKMAITDNCRIELGGYEDDGIPSMRSWCEVNDEVTINWLSESYHQISREMFEQHYNRSIEQ